MCNSILGRPLWYQLEDMFHPIRPCCRSFLLRDQDFSHELSQAGDTADEKIGVLESFLMDAKNAIEGMYKDLVEDPAYRNRQANNQGPVSSMHFLHTYLTYIK